MNTQQLQSNLAKLPDLCFTLDEAGGPVIIIAGETGYYPIDPEKYPMSANAPGAFIEKQNASLGVTPPQQKAMCFGSMFGFDVPGADPDAYINKRSA